MARKRQAPEFHPRELECMREGHRLVAGVDEAGRGPLAGPVSVGLAIFHPEFFEAPQPEELAQVDDSKKISEERRDEFAVLLKKHVAFQAVVHVSNRLIDRNGINPCIEFAVGRLYLRAARAGFPPDMLLIDGNYNFKQLPKQFPELRYRSVVKGDSTVFSIAAASILAKTSRDRRMRIHDRMFPGYDLAKHKGYGTAFHREKIGELGVSALHRRSYLRKFLEPQS